VRQQRLRHALADKTAGTGDQDMHVRSMMNISDCGGGAAAARCAISRKRGRPAGSLPLPRAAVSGIVNAAIDAAN
jgi:hypothetical protein